ncbi:hypothetical protein [Herbidospora daliensis]|uniref:hypothetical protein n=1 Tax=Herbidospora daliensis TaxID=295585 RepID=UPI000A65511E|nr:hypothetical protein [Herbidospora daliensis]
MKAAATLARRAMTLGSLLVTTGALALVGLAQPAAASAITLQGTVDCTSSNNYGDTRDWYPSAVNLSTSPATSAPGLVAVPATKAFSFTHTLPAGATSAGVTALCSSGHYPYGDFTGYWSGFSIPAGTTNVVANWGCSAQPVNPGPWVTSCSLTSVSFS